MSSTANMIRPDAQRVHRRVFRHGPDRRRRVELVQLDPHVAVRGPQRGDGGSDAVEPDEAVDRLALDGRLALELQTKVDEERLDSFEVVDNEEDVVHPQDRHAPSLGLEDGAAGRAVRCADDVPAFACSSNSPRGASAGSRSRRTGRVSNGAPRPRTRRSRSSSGTCRDTSRSRRAPRLGSELATQTDPEIIGRYHGDGSTDFWGISFAPSPLDREPFDAPTFDRQARLLRAAWAEFDETAARVSAELRPGVRGGGRSRDRIIQHVLAKEGGDFSKRVRRAGRVRRPADAG